MNNGKITTKFDIIGRNFSENNLNDEENYEATGAEQKALNELCTVTPDKEKVNYALNFSRKLIS